jgi:hypothetical protein
MVRELTRTKLHLRAILAHSGSALLARSPSLVASSGFPVPVEKTGIKTGIRNISEFLIVLVSAGVSVGLLKTETESGK